MVRHRSKRARSEVQCFRLSLDLGCKLSLSHSYLSAVVDLCLSATLLKVCF